MTKFEQFSKPFPVYIPSEDVAGWAVGDDGRNLYIAIRPREDKDYKQRNIYASSFTAEFSQSLGAFPDRVYLHKKVVGFSLQADAAGVPFLVVLAYAKEVILFLSVVIPLVDGFLPTIIKWWKMIFAPKDVRRAIKAYEAIKGDAAKVQPISWDRQRLGL